MRYLFGFLCVCALGVVPFVGCGGNGGAGDCRAPLSDYCEGSDCPTWDEAVAEAEEEARQSEDWCYVGGLGGGECGDLRYIMTRVGMGGVVQFFDDSGALVAMEVFSDAPGYCNNTSFNKWYGDRPDCELELSHTFCKGSGYEYCSAVEQCGAISEDECLARYDDPVCWAKWEGYVSCLGGDGTCESCTADRLPEWQECAEPSTDESRRL
jgi:hypothetical protein